MTGLAYDGRELEALTFAPNYHGWILARFRPWLGRRLVEVGAGSGNFSSLLVGEPIESLHLVEPSTKMFERLRGVMASAPRGVAVDLRNAFFRTVAPDLARDRVDSVLYVNVLEHIDDDAGELEAMYRTLVPGGRVFIFVPALPFLYGSHDAEVGHFRRYRRRELLEKCQRAGFAVRDLRWFDIAGILPWWIKYRLLRSTEMESGAVKLYDNLVVPIMSRAEGILPPPIGKNLLLVGQKPT